MRALLVVSKARATVRALSIRKAGATTLTLLAVSLCGPEPGTVWRARRAVAFYDRRQDTRAGAFRPRPSLPASVSSTIASLHALSTPDSGRAGQQNQKRFHESPSYPALASAPYYYQPSAYIIG